MRRARRADVDEVDVVARDQLVVRVVHVGYAELLGERPRALDDGIGDGHELAARVALVAGQVRELGPRAGTEHADAHAPVHASFR